VTDLEAGVHDARPRAYEQRTAQLYETRGALAEAVATLTVELRAIREDLVRVQDECDRLRADNQALRDNAHSLTDQLQQAHERGAALEAELKASQATAAALANLKVVRWTGPLRRAVFRLRHPRG
jgi:chromosome segregation ATPase